MICRINCIRQLTKKINKLHSSVTFIGMPGCGKSFLSKYYGEKYNIPVIELDDMIVKECNKKSLFEVIDIYGDNEFSIIENNAILSIPFNKTYPKIISPGGSVIYCKKGMEYLCKNNLMIHLDVDFEILKERTDNFTNRGIVFNGLTPIELYEQRMKIYYQYADISIDPKNKCNLSFLNSLFLK